MVDRWHGGSCWLQPMCSCVSKYVGNTQQLSKSQPLMCTFQGFQIQVEAVVKKLQPTSRVKGTNEIYYATIATLYSLRRQETPWPHLQIRVSMQVKQKEMRTRSCIKIRSKLINKPVLVSNTLGVAQCNCKANDWQVSNVVHVHGDVLQMNAPQPCLNS
jgi:hypothetical protein